MAFSMALLGALAYRPPWAGEYFLTSLGYDSTPTGTEISRGVAFDSSGNFYVVGYTNQPSIRPLITKHDSTGTVQWQRTLLGGNTTFSAVAVDSSGNVYACGSVQGTGGSGLGDGLVVKYDASGNLLWKRAFGGTSHDSFSAIAVDSSNNIYVAGYARNNSAEGALIAKYDSSGNIQWQRTLDGSYFDSFYGVAIDSSNNIYVAGHVSSSTSSSSKDALIAKYNSSGAIQWQRTLGGSLEDSAKGICVDSSGNIYVAVETRSAGAGAQECLLAKYNSSGTVQWQRTLGSTSTDQPSSIAADSVGNIYVIGHTNNSFSTDGGNIFFAKYNSSGTIQWQRTLGGNEQDIGKAIAIDSSDNVFVTGYSRSAGTIDWIIAKLPNDGSLTGSYILGQRYVNYAANSLTSASASLASSSSSVSNATSSFNSVTPTSTSESTSMDQQFRGIGTL